MKKDALKEYIRGGGGGGNPVKGIDQKGAS